MLFRSARASCNIFVGLEYFLSDIPKLTENNNNGKAANYSSIPLIIAKVFLCLCLHSYLTIEAKTDVVLESILYAYELGRRHTSIHHLLLDVTYEWIKILILYYAVISYSFCNIHNKILCLCLFSGSSIWIPAKHLKPCQTFLLIPVFCTSFSSLLAMLWCLITNCQLPYF